MTDLGGKSSGFWVFLTFALPVLGGAIGIFYVRYAAPLANPVLWLVIGAVAGWLLGKLLLRLADKFGWRG